MSHLLASCPTALEMCFHNKKLSVIVKLKIWRDSEFHEGCGVMQFLDLNSINFRSLERDRIDISP